MLQVPLMAQIFRFFSPIFFLIAASAFGRGGMDSGGGDNRGIATGSAWFLGERSIRYCVEIGPAFGITSVAAQREIESVARTWKTYLNDKQMLGLEDTKADYAPALNYVLQPRCDSSTDLFFYFGVENKKTKRAKKLFENPTAFAIREAYDSSKGWGKGFIWVSPPFRVYPDARFPDWSRPERLHGTLLHEIGHVLGFGHSPGTIMEEDLTPWMQFDAESTRAREVLTHIDDRKELYICERCGFRFIGNLGGDSAQEAVLFHSISGREPIGEIRTELLSLPSSTSFKLTVVDAVAGTSVKIQPLSEGTAFSLVSGLFKRVRRTSDGVDSGVSLEQRGLSILGLAVIEDKIRTVAIERNASDVNAPMIAYVIQGNSKTRLFTAKLRGLDLRP
jgi:hypothetical protein